jgi:NtrC-family two-component system sensor histidine kinase KinB
MLKARIFSGLATLVLLLAGVGIAGLLLIRSSSRDFTRQMYENYASISAAQSFRLMTSTNNSFYIPQIVDAPDGVEVKLTATIFESTEAKMTAALGTLDARIAASAEVNPGAAERAGKVVERLRPAVAEYLRSFREVLSSPPAGRAERAAAVSRISSLSQRITDLSQSALAIFEEHMFSSAEKVSSRAQESVIFIITLMVIGAAIAVMIFFQLVRAVVDPVVSLTESIREVKRGNFELSLQAPRSRTELSELIPAFNEMAAELRIRRRQMDARLMETNMQNRAILAAIPSPVFMLDDHGEVTQINPAAEELLGHLHLSDRLPAKIEKRFLACRESGENYLPQDPRDAVLFRIEEMEVFYLPRVFRFSTPDRERQGWAVLLMDVTRFRWLDDMKTNLLSTVSHEIKTPLTGIRMVLHLLLEEKSGALSPMQKTMLNSANEDCDRLLSTLNRLLELARVESGASRLVTKPCILMDSVDRARVSFGAAAETKKITFSTAVEPDLPDVMIDPVMIDEVFNNLISNAIKHSPENSQILLRIRRLDHEFLRASVIDSGTGVPESSQGRIFDKFYRAPGQSIEGVGLGLAIAREIMAAHEGRIGLRERNGEQTEFYVDVPIA